MRFRLHVLHEIEKIQRRNILAVAIAPQIAGDAAILVGQGCELGRPVGAVAADAMQENQRLSLAGNVNGEAWGDGGA